MSIDITLCNGGVSRAQFSFSEGQADRVVALLSTKGMTIESDFPVPPSFPPEVLPPSPDGLGFASGDLSKMADLRKLYSDLGR